MLLNLVCAAHLLHLFRLSCVKRSSIHFLNANCLLGELLKDYKTLSADCIILLISLMLQHFTIHRFNLCDAQCV